MRGEGKEEEEEEEADAGDVNVGDPDPPPRCCCRCCAQAGTGGTGGSASPEREVADLVRRRGGGTESAAGGGLSGAPSLRLILCGSAEGPEDGEGKVSLENIAPRVRLRARFFSASPVSSSEAVGAAVATGSGSVIVLDSARGERCRMPPPGVGGALRTEAGSASSKVAAIEGPASGEERMGREACTGERAPMVWWRRVESGGRSGIMSLWSVGRRSGE